MKFFVFILLWCLCGMTLQAQFVYYPASDFPLLGKISEKTETRYERLPALLNGNTRPPVWELGKNTAGLAIRFVSDSKAIAVRWTLRAQVTMSHMALTGIQGLDLYTLEGKKWRFVNVARPEGKENTAVIISNMEPVEREYMLYLPLYDGVVSLEIGVDSTASIGQPKVDLPVRDKPVVCYGTSILQGGCASRPGMAHTNILSRRLNREFVNLGFSGNGQLDYEIAGIMTNRDAALYILDFVPNASVQQIEEKAERFFRIIRDKAPDVPVIFVEDPPFTHSKYDRVMQQEIERKNKALHIVFDRLKKAGEKSIWLLPSEKIIGDDAEATVDGIHFTDLGFMRYAEYLYPVIKKRMKKE
ncbi:SGNH/GDSL hydrolase family protein [Culturomica massiliensis]|jgi:lysophospholipase L1-like esterase|uniref:SGNH/GDSL hydrolase family protein n=1 Tax=Culturomica massiliensis TaxID=1841857 RepID=UPI00033A382E|nr:SGNH/GDSL hydrolase family protein [Culturomica massiliensis]CCZ08185.1 putative uncharacterized protein [Odoribacter sp. CAG:788]